MHDLSTRMTTKVQTICLMLILLLVSCTRDARSVLVNNIEEFNHALPTVQPGDKIILSNGIWNDVELKFQAEGLPDKPIHLVAEEPGKVIITGQSNLGISGRHIVVSNLVFKDGFTPTSEVISFRTSKENLANNVRVTNVVIDNFSNPERLDSDTWVAIYGKNNRFDHNSLLNKRNRGVTLAVKLTTEASRENGHVIEYNYFGPRQILGSNGGETLRIGTSHFSRTYSNTIVQNNYFDRTSGELEIVSSKSCGNVFRANVFYESQGTLTMRHGHHTLVENNYFLGNRKPNTGGIRVINEYQTVRNNYLYGLTGHRFRGALVIMNGVPNSPLNRYNQVVDSEINGNIVIDSDHIQLCAGSDAERSAAPIGSSMHDNIIMSKTNLNAFAVYDDISGISFEGNILNEEADVPIETGFSKAPYSVTENRNGLRVPSQSLLDQIAFGEVKLPVSKEETGANFYPRVGSLRTMQSGKILEVKAGTDTIVQALGNSNPGDTLLLENGGQYLMTKYAIINHPITIKTKPGDRAIVNSEKSSFFIIENGGALELENLRIDGAESPDLAGNNIISTSRYSMNRNYALAVRDCKVSNLDVNHSFDFLKVYPSTFADSIEILNTEMHNITGSVLSLNKETDDLGVYNVENLIIKNSSFKDIQGSLADIYRGGTDESTFGPVVVIDGNEFINAGLGKRNRSRASLKFHGVQKLLIADSRWQNSAPLDLHLTNGEPITVIKNVLMEETGKIRANSNEYKVENLLYQ